MNARKIVPFSILVAFALLGAFAPTAAPTEPAAIDGGDTAWMLTATSLVLLMTPGLSFFYGGMVRSKNVVSTMLQSFVAMGAVSLIWVAFGFSLCFGESMGGFVGNPLTFAMFRGVGAGSHPDLAPTIPLMLFALFQLKFAIITPALITGAFAERVRFHSYLLFMVLFSICIYAPLAHMTWHPDGLLRNMGVLDFAGGTVVHMSAGYAALAGAWVLGPRRGAPDAHMPANIPFVMLGTGMLWFGWFGFNAGSALAADGLAAQAFLTTNTASAAAMMAWMLFDAVKGARPTAMGACIGAVVGLVAITPAAGFVSVGASIFIGVSASIISNLAVHWRSRTELDDTLDVFPCHGLGGIVGMVLTAVFATDGGLVPTGEVSLVVNHLIALVGVSVFALGGSVLLFWLVGRIMPLRVSESDEAAGLDQSMHGEKYPHIEGLAA